MKPIYLLRLIDATAKNGWFQSDCVNDTAGVSGSVNQCHAPAAVHTDMTAKTTGGRENVN